MQLTLPWLGVLALVMAAIAVAAPVHWLIYADLQTVAFKGLWSLGGVRTDATDLMIGFLLLSFLVKGVPREGPRIRKPYFLAWLLLGVFFSISYLSVPINQPNLTDPVRIAYQLYRYCWKPLLYYPICLLLLRSPERVQAVLAAIFVGSDMIAIQTIYQGHTGQDPAGPFKTGNALAGTLVMPIVLAFATCLFPTSRRWWWFSGLSFLVMARAIMMSGSRGGAVASVAGCSVFLLGLLFVGVGRRRLVQLVPLAVVLPLLVFLLVPDLMERPNVKRMMSVSEGTRVDNFQWRMNERWPHFWDLAFQHPWVGRGSDVDWSLGVQANTPHNGYLSIAVRYGFPVLIFFAYMALRTLGTCLRRFVRVRDTRTRLFYLTVTAPIVGMLIHNVVEVTWTDVFVLKIFWILVAVTALSVRLGAIDLVPRAERERERRAAGTEP